jgi:hypothetical protein
MDETQFLVQPLNGPSFHNCLAAPKASNVGHCSYFVITITRTFKTQLTGLNLQR